MPVTPSAPLSRAQPGAELTPGRQWQAVLSQAVDGRPLLSGDGIQLALPAWPPGAAELSPGTVLKVLVLATQPRLQLSLQLERQGRSLRAKRRRAHGSWSRRHAQAGEAAAGRR